MRQVAAFQALSEHVAGRVHPSVADDPTAGSRHRAFILTHLAIGALPFAALPPLLALGQHPGALGLAAFAWLAGPIVVALELMRAGRLDRAQGFAALLFCGLAVAVTIAGGGAMWPLALLVLPVIDAALSGARAGLRAACAIAAAAAGLIAVLQVAGVAAPAEPALAIVGSAAALIYGLALGARAYATSRALERAGKPSDAAFERFAGSMDDLVTRHAPTGAVTFASSAARALLDASPRELADQGLFARVHIADRPLFLQALSAARDSAETIRVEIRIARGRGLAAFVWTEMRARAVRPHEADAASAAAAPVVAMFRDVTAMRAHEADLIAAREEAEKANVAKTRFLAHMSHELRTPLNAIIGFSEVLADETLCRLTPERRADYAALIHRSGAHLLEVVNSILDMARIESGAFPIAPRACAMRPLGEHVVNLLALKAEAAGVALELSPSLDPSEIDADPRAVTQILLNLVGNALKFTPRGGDITVSFAPKGHGVLMSVRDTGIGIAPEHLSRLGEAFYQPDVGYGRPEGAGLGLSVVRGLVALHGGDLAVESALGRGTTVNVYLPHRGPAAAASRDIRVAAAA